jgi:hypothetical protein
LKIAPSWRAERFAQLKPGDLLIHPFHGQPCFALKVIDPTQDGDTYVLPLGPTFPSGGRQPLLYDEHGATTISCGSDFVLQLSNRPSAWSLELPDTKYFCVALVGEVAYLRANYDRFDRRYLTRWVRITDGVLCENIAGVAAFAIEWTITIPQGALPPLKLMEYTGTPLSDK